MLYLVKLLDDESNCDRWQFVGLLAIVQLGEILAASIVEHIVPIDLPVEFVGSADTDDIDSDIDSDIDHSDIDIALVGGIAAAACTCSVVDLEDGVVLQGNMPGHAADTGFELHNLNVH